MRSIVKWLSVELLGLICLRGVCHIVSTPFREKPSHSVLRSRARLTCYLPSLLARVIQPMKSVLYLQVLVAEAWCPVSGKQKVQDALNEVAQRTNSSVSHCSPPACINQSINHVSG